MGLHSDFGERTINELMLMFRHKQINLNPGFQRQSVWSYADRRRLIQSIIASCPVPSIFLYRRNNRGKLMYDVIDGKQRLETLFMFARQGRFKRNSFDVKLDLGDGEEWQNWRDLIRYFPQTRNVFESYKIPTVEVDGDFNEIVDLFVRINSTGKPLTSGEKRHARFYNSLFLKEAERLVGRFRKYFLKQRILSEAQIGRMKGTELLAELLMSIHQGGVINKKTSLDRAIGNEAINRNTLARISRECISTLNTLRRMFPEIKSTRFHNLVDFYSLFLVVWEMRSQNFVLADRKRNRIADGLVRRLSTGVDELREQLKKAISAKPQQRLYADYLITVQGSTDTAVNRQRRGELLKGVLWSLLERKDDKRMFSGEQRRILWNTDEKKTCRKCKKQLSWEDFTVDHVRAWIKGGRTTLKNAQPMCQRCNSGKGGR